MDYDIDIQGMEQQRYDTIKKSGKYLELNVLIGTEKQIHNEKEGTIPVISMEMRQCGPTEVSRLYSILHEVIKQLEQEYPAECIYAALKMNTTTVNHIIIPADKDEKQKED